MPDTIAILRNQVTELKKFAGLKADTVYITKEIVKQLKGDSLQTDYETTRLLQVKNDTIISLRKRVYELQNSSIIRADTVYVIKEPSKSPVAESRQSDYMTQQLIKAKDEQIQILQNQLNVIQNAAARTPEQAKIASEPAQAQLVGSQQTNQLSLQLLQTKNDTIQFLRRQLQNLQIQSQKRDTIYIEKKDKELQPVKEFVPEQKTSELFQALLDTIGLLKTSVLSLEEQILPGMETITPVRQDEKDIPHGAITDTTLIVGYYELGEIKPLEEESLLKQIKELCSNKNVIEITLSGYTDSSGNEAINERITNMRINYLSEKISSWIEKDKVYFQNFGDTFASEMTVNDERRIEIRIYTK